MDLIACLLVFPLLAFGPAWPWASRLRLDPAEKVVATALASLLVVYLAAFALYACHLPAVALRALPLFGVAGLWLGRRELAATWRDPDARALIVGQAILTGWVLGWLSFVTSYSGGGWAGDWYEHWERTRFFTERWPLDTKFLGFGALAARPPLANLLTGAVLGGSAREYPAFQLALMLLNVLVFLPAALLARRFSRGSPATATAVIGAAAVLLMVNPSFMENVTFAWTKLVAAGFILGAWYFFLRAHDPDPPPVAVPLFSASLAAGMLAHYSAGPYVLVLGLAWFGLNHTRLGSAAFWRSTVLAAAIGAGVLATWLAWSIATYGVDVTFGSNTAVTAADADAGNQVVKIGLNIWDTLVPHFFRRFDSDLIDQASSWGHARDWLFQLYQVNLFLVFGSVAWLAILVGLRQRAAIASARSRWFWCGTVGGAALIGIAVHGARDHWGLAHICLQPLVVLGLAWLAASWKDLKRGWQFAVLVGAAVDCCLGIAMQFAAESQTPDLRYLLQEATPGALPQFSATAVMNLAGKLQHHLRFFADVWPLSSAVTVVLLAALLVLALRRARQTAP